MRAVRDPIAGPSYGDFLNSFAIKAGAGPYGSYDKLASQTSDGLGKEVSTSEKVNSVIEVARYTRAHLEMNTWDISYETC